MLTDDTLRKVRETARIDEVASGYLTLHRSGRTSWRCARSTTSGIPPSASPRRGTSEVLQLRRGGGPDTARATWRDAASRRQYAYWHANTISRWKRPLPLVVSGGGTSGKRCCWRTPRSLAACYRATRRYGTYGRGSPWAGRDLPRLRRGTLPARRPQVFRPS